MKTLRLLMAIGLMLGSYTIGMAQSTATPTFKSDAEKQAWQDANTVKDELDFESDAEKQAWIDANPERYKQVKASSSATVTKRKQNTVKDLKVSPDVRRIDVNNPSVQTAQPAKVRVSNVHKAVPANYKPTIEGTKPSEK